MTVDIDKLIEMREAARAYKEDPYNGELGHEGRPVADYKRALLDAAQPVGWKERFSRSVGGGLLEELQTCRASVADLQAEQFWARKRRLRTAEKQLQEAAAKYVTEALDLQTHVSQLQAELATTTRERDEARGRGGDLQARVVQLQAELEMSRGQLLDALTEIKRLGSPLAVGPPSIEAEIRALPPPDARLARALPQLGSEHEPRLCKYDADCPNHGKGHYCEPPEAPVPVSASIRAAALALYEFLAEKPDIDERHEYDVCSRNWDSNVEGTCDCRFGKLMDALGRDSADARGTCTPRSRSASPCSAPWAGARWSGPGRCGGTDDDRRREDRRRGMHRVHRF